MTHGTSASGQNFGHVLAPNPSQVDSNLEVGNMAPLTPEQNRGVEQVYDDLISRHVHARW